MTNIYRWHKVCALGRTSGVSVCLCPSIKEEYRQKPVSWKGPMHCGSRVYLIVMWNMQIP